MKKEVEKFDTVAYFKAVKQKMAKLMRGKTLEEKKKILQELREGKVKLP